MINPAPSFLQRFIHSAIIKCSTIKIVIAVNNLKVRSSLEADLHPIQIVHSVPRAESGTLEVATFLINVVDHHKNDCIPAISDFVLCGEKINLNMSMG